MPLPIIENPNPVVTPAVAERQYNESYLVELRLSTPTSDGTVQPLRAVYRPYEYATQTLYPSHEHDFTVTVENIWPLAVAHPLTAQVVGGLIAVLTLEENLRKAEAAVVDSQATLDGANNRIAMITEQLLTATDAEMIALITDERESLLTSLPDLGDAANARTTERDAILTQLGVV